MDQRVSDLLMRRLNADAARIARCFGLRYRAIEAERAGVKRRYGVCFADGSIRIRLRHVATGHSLKYSSLVSTLCHELAHLRYFNHGLRFRAFYRELLEYARREGIYQPGPAPQADAARIARAPRRSRALPRATGVQLELFGAGSGRVSSC